MNEVSIETRIHTNTIYRYNTLQITAGEGEATVYLWSTYHNLGIVVDRGDLIEIVKALQ